MTIVHNVSQSSSAVIPWPCDFGNSMLTGDSVASAVITHTPPSGAATSPSQVIASNIVYAVVGPLTVTGVHEVLVVETSASGYVDDILLIIRVDF